MKKIATFITVFCCTASLSAQPTYTHVECGTEFTLALRSDSTLWACGNNTNGQLGNSIYTKTDTPVAVEPAQKWIFAATGSIHGLAIAADSTLWAWGLSGNGQLGIGSTSIMVAPTQVSPVQHWRYVSAGEAHTAAILNDGTLWATGMNTYGQLGTGDTVQHTSFVQIGTAGNWKTVSAGGVFTLGIKQDGTLWGWGYNGDGELGMGNTTGTYFAPTQIGTATDWTMVSGGFEYSLALKSDGTIWATGFNGNGQLGISSITSHDSSFTQIGTGTDWKYIAAGSSFGFGIKANGTLWAWGFNDYGQLGFGTAMAAMVTQVGTDTDWHYISAADGAVTTGGVFGFHSAGLRNIAEGICTSGADYAGQLGNGVIVALPGGQDFFGCSVGKNTTGIASLAPNQASISIYPNPASDKLTISSDDKIIQVTITTLLGQTVFSQEYNTNEARLSVAGLAAGVYLVKINGTEVRRFVKE